MKVKKKKGRVDPCLSTVVSCYRDPSSVLKQLLPVAILGIALPLPPQDQQVLAYMITRSRNIPSTTSTTGDHHQHPKTKTKYCSNGKGSSGSGSGSVVVVVSECGCFDCYTRFWHRWDSSPNRDLIHQVIEAFEDHLLLLNDIDIDVDVPNMQKRASATRKKHYYCCCNGVLLSQSQDSSGGREEEQGGNLELMEVVSGGGGGSGVSISHNHKGLARKVLPDVVGLFNSRLWTLWSPTI